MYEVKATWIVPILCLCHHLHLHVSALFPIPGDQLSRMHGHEWDVSAHGVLVPAQL